MMASFKQKSAVFDYFEMPDHTSGKYRAKCKTLYNYCNFWNDNSNSNWTFIVFNLPKQED